MKTSKIISTIFKYIILLSIVGYLVYVVVRIMCSDKDEVCTGIVVQFENDTTNALVSNDEIKKLLTTHNINPVGKSLSNIEINVIDSLLKESPYIDSVVSFPNSSGELCIRLTTSQPLLQVIPNRGSEFYLESNGKVLPRSGQNANLCVVTGDVTQHYAKRNLLSLGKILRDDPYWRLQAQQINITSEGKIQLVPRMGNHILVLGDSRNIADKLYRIRMFYEKGMPLVGWDTYKTISAEFDGQLVCTRK